MKAKEEKMTVGRMTIAALLQGEKMKSRDVANHIAESSGKNVKIQEVTSTLAKISDQSKCDLGYFVNKIKDNGRFSYLMVEEARSLNEEQAYGLSLKIGKNRYTLEDALKDFPELQKYVTGKKGSAAKRSRKKEKGVDTPRQSNQPGVKSETVAPSVERTQESKKALASPTESILAQAIREIIQNGVNININVNFRFDGK